MKGHAIRSRAAPLAVGTGLVALDVILADGSTEPARQWAGGTCGNVLIALRYLGWRSAPIARLREGEAAKRLIDDLRRWDVSTEFVSVRRDGSTPIVVHRIRRTALGEPYHTFSWRCPSCGARLPAYKPVLASAAHGLVHKLGTPRVFFFDRVSRGALVLARECAALGAAVVFEPISISNPSLFREAWTLAHLVKYSHERLQELPSDLEKGEGTRMQIETLGREGLRYRTLLPRCKTRTWQYLQALPAGRIKDTAGAGDWCSAGIIDKLVRGGASALTTATDTTVRRAIQYGQAIAAWNCRFEGARGAMYAVARETFGREVRRIVAGRMKSTSLLPEATSSVKWKAYPCPSCGVDANIKRARH